jgi:hypothetical protein
MVPLLPPGPAELRVLPGCLAEPSAQTESVPSALVRRWVLFSQALAVAKTERGGTSSQLGYRSCKSQVITVVNQPTSTDPEPTPDAHAARGTRDSKPRPLLLLQYLTPTAHAAYGLRRDYYRLQHGRVTVLYSITLSTSQVKSQ